MATYNKKNVNGVNIFYREASAPNAPTIVLLHGFPSSSFMYRNLLEKLSDRFHLIAPDYPGFGYSDAPSPNSFKYKFDNIANFMAEFLKSSGLNRFHLYMHDYGAPVGFRIAVKHPEWIRSLIIQNANAYKEGLTDVAVSVRPFWENRTPETEVPIRQMFTAESVKTMYLAGVRNPENISPDSWSSDLYFLSRSGIIDIQLELLHDYPSNIAAYPQWQAYLREHQPKSLVVWGKNDIFFSTEGAIAYKKDLKNVEVYLLDTGHFALEEEGDVIAGHIRRFLTTYFLPKAEAR